MNLNELIDRMETEAEAAEAKQTSGPEVAVTRYWLDLVRTLEMEPSSNGDEPDRMLSAREVATRLGMSEAWVYRHADALPFAKKYPSGAVRFSSRGLERWLSRRT